MPMITSADLPDTIPVFPLPGALMLPRARLPLHIFEPRYLAMIEDCLKTSHRLIGMIQPRETPASEKRAGEKRLQAIGCAVTHERKRRGARKSDEKCNAKPVIGRTQRHTGNQHQHRPAAWFDEAP